MPRSHKISTLWILVLFNMVFADILSFMYPGFLVQITSGMVDGVTITPHFLLIAAVFVEIAILMIYLSRVLTPRIGRVVNLMAVTITILFVVGGGAVTPHYIFFASIEVISMLYIAYLAWSWHEEVIA